MLSLLLTWPGCLNSRARNGSVRRQEKNKQSEFPDLCAVRGVGLYLGICRSIGPSSYLCLNPSIRLSYLILSYLMLFYATILLLLLLLLFLSYQSINQSIYASTRLSINLFILLLSCQNPTKSLAHLSVNVCPSSPGSGAKRNVTTQGLDKCAKPGRIARPESLSRCSYEN